MNMNKPVAFMNPTGLQYKQTSKDFMYNDSLYNPKLDWIPLYTHPVKELTDEEIKQIFVEESGFDVDTCPIAIMDFARAILRKAQEK